MTTDATSLWKRTTKEQLSFSPQKNIIADLVVIQFVASIRYNKQRRMFPFVIYYWREISSHWGKICPTKTVFSVKCSVRSFFLYIHTWKYLKNG